jgi:hypothetical protein
MPSNQWRLHVAKACERGYVLASALTKLFNRFLIPGSSSVQRQCCEKLRTMGNLFENVRRGLLGDFTKVARRTSFARTAGAFGAASTSVACAFASTTAGGKGAGVAAPVVVVAAVVVVVFEARLRLA